MTQIAAPKPVFDGVKEWPAPPPAAGSVAGHNRPPPSEMVVIELNEALDGREGFRKRIADIIAKGAAPEDCEDDDRAGRYGDFIRIAQAAQQFIDGERVRIKAPYLEATRAIDGSAKALNDQIGDAIGRVRAKLNAYAAKVAQRQREEAQRIADEQARLRRQAEEQAAPARAAAAARDGAASPAAAPPPEPSPPPAPVASIPKVEPTVIRGDLGSRVGVKMEKVITIADVKKLPKNILNHPKVHEAALAVVKARVKGGETDIAGVEIGEQAVSSVR